MSMRGQYSIGWRDRGIKWSEPASNLIVLRWLGSPSRLAIVLRPGYSENKPFPQGTCYQGPTTSHSDNKLYTYTVQLQRLWKIPFRDPQDNWCGSAPAGRRGHVA
jgi:hypothetical protein